MYQTILFALAIAANPTDYAPMKQKWEAAMKEKLASYVADAEALVEREKGVLAERQEDLKKVSKNPSKKAELSKAKALVRNAEAKLSAAESSLASTKRRRFALDPRDLKADFFGKLGANSDETTPPQFKVLQILNDNTALMTYGEETYWVDLPTAGLVDGRRVEITDWVHCTGTKQYKTVLGGNSTVLALKIVR